MSKVLLPAEHPQVSGTAAPAAATGARWFGTGRSVAADARAAGAEAAAAAVQGRTAALLVVLCPADIDRRAMLAGGRGAAGAVPLMGCSGIAQRAPNGPAEAAVVVNALGGDGFEIRTTVARGVSAGQRAAGERVAESVQAIHSENKMLL